MKDLQQIQIFGVLEERVEIRKALLLTIFDNTVCEGGSRKAVPTSMWEHVQWTPWSFGPLNEGEEMGGSGMWAPRG